LTEINLALKKKYNSNKNGYYNIIISQNHNESLFYIKITFLKGTDLNESKKNITFLIEIDSDFPLTQPKVKCSTNVY